MVGKEIVAPLKRGVGNLARKTKEYWAKHIIDNGVPLFYKQAQELAEANKFNRRVAKKVKRTLDRIEWAERELSVENAITDAAEVRVLHDALRSALWAEKEAGKKRKSGALGMAMGVSYILSASAFVAGGAYLLWNIYVSKGIVALLTAAPVIGAVSVGASIILYQVGKKAVEWSKGDLKEGEELKDYAKRKQEEVLEKAREAVGKA